MSIWNTATSLRTHVDIAMTESEVDPAGRTRIKPGGEMKKLRERAGVTINEIAERTMITRARLQALENDDYDNVGSVAYITGYARSYAKVVGFDPTSHIEAFEQAVGFEREEVVGPSANFMPAPKRVYLPSMSAIAALALLVLIIVLGVGYWLTRESATTAETIESSEREFEPMLPDLSASRGQTNNRRPSPEATDVSETRQAPLPITVTERGSAAPESTTIQPRSAPSAPARARDLSRPGTDAGMADRSQPASETPATPVATTSGSSAQASTSQAPALASSELVIRFTDECWLRVTDARGKRLFENIKQAGDRLTLTGVAPFDLKLGNARAVTIALNGNAVTVPTRTGRRTLELSVGG